MANKHGNKGLRSILKTEHFAGDSMKVVGEMCHQLCDYDKLQNQEIMDLLKDEFDSHPLPKLNKTKKRPKATGRFVTNYHSGNDLTRSKVSTEKNAANRLAVIRIMAEQLSVYDGMSSRQILALTKSYLDNHIIEEDI